MSVWPLLFEARHFTLEMTSLDGGDPRIVQRGSGRIRTEPWDSAEGSAVVWREWGRWTEGSLAGVKFRNSTVWRRRAGWSGLELSHLRRGDRAPTFLVDLEPDRSGFLASRLPHDCGLDRYSASLRWDGSRLELCWAVRSPTDPYRLRLLAWRAGPKPRTDPLEPARTFRRLPVESRSRTTHLTRELEPMAKHFGCGDVIEGCQVTFTAENEQEIVEQVAKHAAAAHGLTEVTPEILARVKAAIRDAPRT